MKRQASRYKRGSGIAQGMGKKPRRHRRAFTPEFKAEIVELCQRVYLRWLKLMAGAPRTFLLLT